MRCHQLTQNLCRKWDSTPESTKAQLVAEQEGLAWAICKWEQGRNCSWNLLGGFIYVLGCLNECLQNSRNSNKQTYLQPEQPPLCAGFGFLETRMVKKNKKGGGNQLFTGFPVTNQGSHKKSSVPIECPLPFPTGTSRQALQGAWAEAANAVRALHGQASGSIWKPLENTSRRLFTEPSHSPYAEEKWKVGKEKHKQGKGADDLLLMYRLQPTNTSDLYFSFSVREKLSYF